jgi:hypothetical protein
MFKKIRIAILILILLIVVSNNYHTKANSVSWKYTLWVNIYPINGDNSAVVDAYIKALNVNNFHPVEEFVSRSAKEFGATRNAGIEIRLHKPLSQRPPSPPINASKIEVMWWSLQFRWWAYRYSDIVGPGPQVRLFVQYFDPKNTHLLHSTALQKGLIGQVNAYASNDMNQQNNIIVAHEFLHTLGATDKYDLSNNQPLFPDGFAEPKLSPSYPQKMAEIMAGRIPISPQDAVIPNSLNDVMMGEITAREIQVMGNNQR